MGIIMSITASVLSSVIGAIVVYELKSRRIHEEQERKIKAKRDLLILKNIDAIGCLSEKIAVCVKNERVNGDMEHAREYVVEQRHDLEDFMKEQIITNI